MTTKLRQKLFDYFSQEHGISLMDSDFIEMENILIPTSEGRVKVLTKEEILTKYSDGSYKQFKGHENIFLAMEEYSQQDKGVCKWISWSRNIFYDPHTKVINKEYENFTYCPFCGLKIERI